METVSGLHGPAGTGECLKAANFSAKLNYLQQQQKKLLGFELWGRTSSKTVVDQVTLSF